MTAWDNHARYAQGQLRVTGGHAGESDKALNALVPTLSESATTAGPVAAMAERIQAAARGAAEATNAYAEGDMEAAKHAQDAARAVRPDLLTGNDGAGGGR
jgi:hypothetical protein